MQKIPIRHLTATQKEPGLSDSFSIRNVHDLLEGKDMVQELHRHDFYFILVLEKGSGTHDIDFKPYPVCDHCVFFMRPAQVHQLVLHAGSTGYLMQFTDEFYYANDKLSKQLLRRVSATNYYQLNSKRFQKLLTLPDYIFGEYTGRQEKYQEVIKAGMRIFFVELARVHNATSTDKASLYTQEKLEAFFELLETHVFTHKQVADYASMMNLSIWQLNAVTKATLGKTSSELINEYIILEAKRHLLATSSQINQIADHLGYEDVSYFIRFFKKHTGHSPEAFRQHFRG